eukprot:7297223-Alexandrium_andersonii.AAC.1
MRACHSRALPRSKWAAMAASAAGLERRRGGSGQGAAGGSAAGLRLLSACPRHGLTCRLKRNSSSACSEH